MLDPKAGPIVSLSADKKSLSIANPDGSSITIPIDYVTALVTMLGQANAVAVGPEAVQIFPVEWWNMFPDAEMPDHFLLYFRIQGALQIAFRVHRDMGPEYIKQLQALLDKPIASPSGAVN